MEFNFPILNYCFLAGFFACFFTGIWSYYVNRTSIVNKAWMILSIHAGIWSLSHFFMAITVDKEIAWIFCYVVYIAAIFIPLHFLRFICYLTENYQLERKKIQLSFWFSFILILFLPTKYFIKDVVPKLSFHYFDDLGVVGAVYLVFYLIVASYAFLILVKVMLRSKGNRRTQLTYMAVAAFFGFLGGGSTFAIAFNNYSFPYFIALFPIYPLVVTYAIVKHNFLDIRIAVSNTAIFIVVYALVLGIPFYIYFLGYKLISLIFSLILATTGPIVFNLLRRQAEYQILQEQKRTQRALKAAFKGLTSIRQLDKLSAMVIYVLAKQLELESAALYLCDQETGAYELMSANFPNQHAVPLLDSSFLIQRLKSDRKAVSFDEIKFNGNQSAKNQTDDIQIAADLHKLSANIVLPLKIEDNLLGFIVLGERKDKKALSVDQIDDFSILGDQAALAIENAMYWEAQRRQVEEESRQARLESLDMLVGTMAHEVDNPLTTVQGNAESIREDVKGVITKIRFEMNPLLMPDGRTILNELIRCGVVEEVVEESRVIVKHKITEISEHGTKILYDLIRNEVVEEMNPTDVRVRPTLEQKEALVRKIAGNDFNKIWELLKVPTEVRLKPGLNEKEAVVRQIAGSHFEIVWDILQDSQRTIQEISPRMRESLFEKCAWIMDNANRVSAIIRSVEMFSKKQKAPLGEVYINSMMIPLNALLALYKKKFRKVELVEEIEEDLPPIWGQAIFVEEIITNLVKNGMMAAAEKHGAGGGRVALKIYRKQENYTVDNIVIETVDNGVGMTEKVLKQVFQVPASNRSSMQGMGVGLYHIRRVVVEVLKGNVQAESEGQGKGSRFVVTLPVYKGEVSSHQNGLKKLF